MSHDYFHELHFSIAGAIESLHHHASMISEIARLAKYLDSTGHNIYSHKYFGGIGANGNGEAPPEIPRLINMLRVLDKAGILVRGLQEGLVDFPHIRKNGEEVYLCFKLGEETIRYWHPIDAGFRGRQPLSTL